MRSASRMPVGFSSVTRNNVQKARNAIGERQRLYKQGRRGGARGMHVAAETRFAARPYWSDSRASNRAAAIA